MKYAHVTIEIRMVGRGVQVDCFDRTLATRDGNGVIHRTECWDFADSQPSIVQRADDMQNIILRALAKECK